ncbi:hypothetical protein QYE76_013455 [Lolium multiflorum]|uniref:CCHC-type domain-containing protein n=1 Tax=Lolium multiflorum TaxID=4521 RepID=A0AAD8U2M0_LOLMU|nr:hypothetical protein QYE76_013455 [Lolium multiflorum]
MASSFTSVPINLGLPPREQLTRDNYPLWRSQVLPAIRDAQLTGILTGADPAPPPEIVDVPADKTTGTAAKLKANPDYATWLSRDQTVLSYLLQSLSREDRQLVSYILAGLGADYNALVAALGVANAPISLSQLYSHIYAYDQRQLMLQAPAAPEFETSANAASRQWRPRSTNDGNYTGRNRGDRGDRRDERRDDRRDGRRDDRPFQQNRGGGRGPSGGGHGRGRCRTTPWVDVTCQICNKEGHYAKDCWSRYANDDDYGDKEVHAAYGVDTNWYQDSGATHHITGELNNLAIRDAYKGHDRVNTANGQGRQNSAGGENLSQNAAPSHSYDSFEFSGENNGSTDFQDDFLSGSSSGSPPASDREHSAPTAPEARVRARGNPSVARSPVGSSTGGSPGHFSSATQPGTPETTASPPDPLSHPAQSAAVPSDTHAGSSAPFECCAPSCGTFCSSYNTSITWYCQAPYIPGWHCSLAVVLQYR